MPAFRSLLGMTGSSLINHPRISGYYMYSPSWEAEAVSEA